jgi:hypothetical protein
MPRPLFEREGIEAEIGRVRSLGLRTLGRTTLRSPPPAFSKDILARFLCWHIQEQAFGGLDSETAKHLGGLARGHERIALGASSPAPCFCADTRASATPSPSLQMAMSGVRRPMRASPPSPGRSPAQPGTVPLFWPPERQRICDCVSRADASAGVPDGQHLPGKTGNQAVAAQRPGSKSAAAMSPLRDGEGRP